MQGSNEDLGPSSSSPETNKACQTIEIILRNINKLDLLPKLQGRQGFVWDDTLIPYSKDQLLRDERKYRDQFCEEQKEHLPDVSRQIQSILKPADGAAPPHLHIIDIGKVFDIGDELGGGRYGMVLAVKLRPSPGGNFDAQSRTFAMKRFPKPLRGPDVENTVKSFKTERHNLERSEKHKHRHLISFHASFTDEKYFGFITSPVAEYNLKSLLEKQIKNNVMLKDEKESLSQAFGCLLEAVRHLHDDLRMRHCDLKPGNILVFGHPGSHFHVRICDLGISHAWNTPQDESTDRNQRGTQRYKAPEVVYGQDISHNRMGDIFSLGCIFLEMLTVLRGRTLDEMARAIRPAQGSSFGSLRTYAESLSGVKQWLEELQKGVQHVAGEDPVSLITNMLHEDRKDRKEAKELLKILCSHREYVGNCCREKPLPAVPMLGGSQSSRPASNLQGPESQESDHESQSESSESDSSRMDYETSRPFKRCRIQLREASNHNSNSEYRCLEDFPQEGEVEIGKTGGKYAWATTRWVKATTSSPSRIEVKEWLPAFYVQAKQIGRQVSFKWSNCDQLKYQRQGDRQQARRFEKVHRSSPHRSNLLMEIDFTNEYDARGFHKLLLEDPFKPKAPVEMQTRDQKSLVIRECKWKCVDKESAADGGKGSLVVCSQHLEQPTPYSWLEPFFVPYNFDFAIPLQNDQKYTKLVSKHLWVPVYRSNVKDRYEEPEERGIFDKVELVRLGKEYTFNFEAGLEAEPSLGNNRNHSLRDFLQSLTDWNLLIVFFATKVLQRSSTKVYGRRSSSKAPSDVLCFQKGKEKRIVIRKESAGDESTVKWTTATLVGSQVNTKAETLEVTLSSIQRGNLLTLASVTAAVGTAQGSSKKTEVWTFTVKHDAVDVHNALRS